MPNHQTIKGYCLPPPRVTRAGYWALTRVLLLPFLGVLLFLDLLFYAIFRYGFDACYGVLCLL